MALKKEETYFKTLIEIAEGSIKASGDVKGEIALSRKEAATSEERCKDDHKQILDASKELGAHINNRIEFFTEETRNISSKWALHIEITKGINETLNKVGESLYKLDGKIQSRNESLRNLIFIVMAISLAISTGVSYLIKLIE